jgi:hypothetical protein
MISTRAFGVSESTSGRVPALDPYINAATSPPHAPTSPLSPILRRDAPSWSKNTASISCTTYPQCYLRVISMIIAIREHSRDHLNWHQLTLPHGCSVITKVGPELSPIVVSSTVSRIVRWSCKFHGSCMGSHYHLLRRCVLLRLMN